MACKTLSEVKYTLLWACIQFSWIYELIGFRSALQNKMRWVGHVETIMSAKYYADIHYVNVKINHHPRDLILRTVSLPASGKMPELSPVTSRVSPGRAQTFKSNINNTGCLNHNRLATGHAQCRNKGSERNKERPEVGALIKRCMGRKSGYR